PLTSGENGEKRLQKEVERTKKVNGTEQTSEDNKKTRATGILDNPLQLGVAFSDFVDVDNFKEYLGKHAPKTEDNFGGRSEEH
ncbi:unnamed protein product, partial [Lymnaea stagnalis]